MSHALILNVRHGGAAAVPEGHVVIVRVVIIVEGPVGAEVHLHRLLWVLNRHAGADEDEALHLPLRLHRADLVRVDDVRDLASSAYLETLA